MRVPKHFILLAAVLLLLTGCGKQAPEKPVREPLPSEYKKVVEMIQIVKRKDGKPTFFLEAEQLVEYENHFEFQALGEVFTYSDGEPELKLTANIANWYEKKERLEAIGNVLITGTKEDFELAAPKVIYEISNEQFTTEGTSVVKTSRYTLISDKLSGDVPKKILYASENVELKDNEGLRVTGSSLEFNWETQHYRIKGPLTVRIGSK